MEVLYVAGPYRSKQGMYGVKKNIDLAIDCARALWLTGRGPVICPHANSYFMDGPDTDHLFLDGDLELIRRVDTVVLLPEWRTSAGAMGEFRLAAELGKRIEVATLEDGAWTFRPMVGVLTRMEAMSELPKGWVKGKFGWFIRSDGAVVAPVRSAWTRETINYRWAPAGEMLKFESAGGVVPTAAEAIAALDREYPLREGEQ